MTTSATPKAQLPTASDTHTAKASDTRVLAELKKSGPHRGRRRRSVPADLWSLAATARRPGARWRDLKDLRARLGELADRASGRDTPTVTIDLREAGEQHPRTQAPAHDGRGADERPLGRATTTHREASTSSRSDARLKVGAGSVDADSMPEQEPAPHSPESTGAAIPLTTKAQVARRDDIWAKNRGRLEAAKARTS